MAYELPPLPYDYAALEPYIDEATMKLHHDKHHQAYVTNLNGAVEKHPELGKKTPEELLKDLASVPEDVRTTVQKQRRRPREPHHVLADHEAQGRRRAVGRDCATDQGRLWLVRGLQEAVQRGDGEAVRLGLGLAGLRGRQAEGRHHAEPGQPDLAGSLPDSGQRRLGACLLSEVPEQAPRLPRRMVEHRELGRSEQAVRDSEEK